MSKWAKIYFRGGQQVSAGRVFEEIAFGKNMIGLRVPEFLMTVKLYQIRAAHSQSTLMRFHTSSTSVNKRSKSF
jgi:hypothetical protein